MAWFCPAREFQAVQGAVASKRCFPAWPGSKASAGSVVESNVRLHCLQRSLPLCGSRNRAASTALALNACTH